MFISLRIFVVSITLMQVCLVLRITDDGNLNLQPIGHIRKRVISKCRAFWQCMGGLASHLADRSTTFPLSSWLWNTKWWKMSGRVCYSEPVLGNFGRYFCLSQTTGMECLLLCGRPRILQCPYWRIYPQWWLVLPKISMPLLRVTG